MRIDIARMGSDQALHEQLFAELGGSRRCVRTNAKAPGFEGLVLAACFRTLP